MNLLPEELKKDVWYEAWRRFVEFFGLYFSVVFLIAVGLLLPSLFFLSYQIEAKNALLETTKQSPRYVDIAPGEEKAAMANEFLNAVVAFDEGHKSLTPAIEDIFNRAGTSTAFTLMNVTRSSGVLGKVEIRGTAATQEDLENLENRLQNSPHIKSFISPNSNYILERDLQFIVTFEIVP